MKPIRKFKNIVFVSGILVLLVIYNLAEDPVHVQPEDCSMLQTETSSTVVQLIHKNGDLDNEPAKSSSQPVTIVTAYFATGKSKHSWREYDEWISNFLTNTATPIVIFTQPSAKSLLSKMRVKAPTHFVIFDEIWDIPWLSEPKLLYEPYHEMHSINPEKDMHSPELYAIWNSKPWMINHVANEINPFNSSYFYWVDIGCVRNMTNQRLEGFLDQDKAMSVFGRNETLDSFHKIQLFAIATFGKYAPPPLNFTFAQMSEMDVIIGGFLGGTQSSISWFNEEFYKLHDQKLSEGQFVGKDQTLYNWLAVSHPEKFWVVYKPPSENSWFYFQLWYGTGPQSQRDCPKSPLQNMTNFLLENTNDPTRR